MAKIKIKIKWLSLIWVYFFVAACAGKAPQINIPQLPPPPVAMSKSPRVVLVLGSGGARGYAHLGVIRALEEAHIPIDAVVGASAGSIIAALYADNANAKKTYEIMMKAGFWDFVDISYIPTGSGVIKGYHLEKFLLNNMQTKTFSGLKKKLVLATTDLNSGQCYPIESGPVVPAILASSALPGAVQPVKLYGRTLIDGGINDPIPVDLAKKLKPKIIIAVNVAEELPSKHFSGALQILSHAYDIIWQRLTELSEKEADVVIHPQLGNTGTFELSKKYQMYQMGLKAAREKIPEIRRLLRLKIMAKASA